MKIFKATKTKLCICLFQWLLLFEYSAPNTIGRMMWLFSLIRFTTYSFCNRAESAGCRTFRLPTYIPVVQRTLSHLEVLTIDALGQLLEERDHDLLEFDRINHIQYLLHLIQIHDLLRAIDLWPEPQQAKHHIFRKRRVLFQELHYAIRQLRVV